MKTVGWRLAPLGLTVALLFSSEAAVGATTALELKASGGNPYAYFKSKQLWPIDGPSSGYIRDSGSYFRFVLHQNGAKETVSSGALRQRNELTVNPSNPDQYKGKKGDTLTYTWRFRIVQMNAKPTWCFVFQLKQHGTTGTGPYGGVQATGSDLAIYAARAGGVVKRVPLSSIRNVWLNATLKVKFADAGTFSMALKRDDGSTVASYTNNGIDMWDATVDFVRPKWGLYRNKKDGAGEAAVDYNNMKIVRN